MKKMKSFNVAAIVSSRHNVVYFYDDQHNIQEILKDDEDIVKMLEGLSPKRLVIALDDSFLRMMVFSKEVNQNSIFGIVSQELSSTDLLCITKEVGDNVVAFTLRRKTWTKLLSLHPAAIIPLELAILKSLNHFDRPVVLKSTNHLYTTPLAVKDNIKECGNFIAPLIVAANPEEADNQIEAMLAALKDGEAFALPFTWKTAKTCQNKEWGGMLPCIDGRPYNLIENTLKVAKPEIPQEGKNLITAGVVVGVSILCSLLFTFLSFHLPYKPINSVILPANIVQSIGNSTPPFQVGSSATMWHLRQGTMDLGSFTTEAGAKAAQASFTGSTIVQGAGN